MMDDKLTAFGRALRIRRRVFLWITAAGLLGLAVCLGLLFGVIWPPLQQGINGLGQLMLESGSFGAFASAPAYF